MAIVPAGEDSRRTLEELITRYEYEPSIKDVFVEGVRDRTLLTWFLEDQGRSDVTVYEIDTVDLNADLVTQYYQEVNARGRVIALAHGLSARGAFRQNIFCMVDQDLDHLRGLNFETELLFFTDHCCIEMYTFNEKVLKKFLTFLNVQQPQTISKHVLTSFGLVLKELFLIRVANAELELGLSKIGLDRCCTLVNRDLSFDVSEFIHKYLNANAQLSKKVEFIRCMDTKRSELPSDPRNAANGHDYLSLLYWYLRKIRRTGSLNDLDAIKAALGMVLEINDLVTQPLFIKLARF